MSECVRCLCYGCMHGKDNKAMHNLCSLLEQYGNEVGFAAFEWLDIFDSDYRHSTWIGGEEWVTTVTPLVLDKWTSQ